MSDHAFSTAVATIAEQFGMPGVSAGVWVNGTEIFAAHGVTSLDNPLPVDEHTLFQLGSVSKTLTATTLMRLVADGKVELDAPLRRYLPELTVAEDSAAARITVAQVLNHTAGLDWNHLIEPGEGDDALAVFTAAMAELPLIGEPGERSSYSQGGYNMLGRVIEQVTGQSYEQAVTELVLAPLGMTNSVLSTGEAMLRRFAVGHEFDADGALAVVSRWKPGRANNPGGGLAAPAVDLLRWARFHLGDGRAADGTVIVPEQVLRSMRRPTVTLRGTSLGDAMGICWFLREVDGVQTAGHGGSGFGQFSELLLVPERNFALVVMSNANPDGIPCNRAIMRWALEHYLGIIDRDPEPLPYDGERAAEVVGHYESEAMTFDITTDGAGLTLEVLIKPELRAASEEEMPADHEPFPFGLLPGDEYIVTAGAFEGQRGYFSRDADGAVIGVDLAGRLFGRVS
ncbi:serine hydrolase domain-containing protein [Nocardia cyriacigeorgica]|uniref:serine hydrolase domain-containing protein n=1 Tax=Nocardia cyriacigeorgica TaxID=135487 RepID=UPI0018960994|nr:serine hydrolase domain-containing protein [Nocardia cyriacigeorgica]MBF6438254.1 beta-lactamase family protein [Nocardia cyriacigeorgica]MBF6453790.1 beta-lactamase family protein [Nocardia cyriacigeorgica]MBF6550958.1 beta-lactamase family protein [Nocardia cyriacigeorgica]